jgi:hypothetical protein
MRSCAFVMFSTGSSVFLTNSGTAPLTFSIPLASRLAVDYISADSYVWGRILPPFEGHVLPGERFFIEFATDLGSLPPGEVSHDVRLVTNAPYSASTIGSVSYPVSSTSVAATGLDVVIPWRISVMQAFVFPDIIDYMIAPTLISPEKRVSVVNFVGAPVFMIARLPQHVSSWFHLNATDTWLSVNSVFHIGCSTTYPSHNGTLLLPGLDTLNLTVTVWREVSVDVATLSDSVSLTAAELVSAYNLSSSIVLSSSHLYSRVIMKNVSIFVSAQIGAPVATLS